MLEITIILPQANPDEWPKIIGVKREAEVILLQLSVLPGIYWFRGHFPDQPVLPGVVQVHWAALLSQKLFDFKQSFSALESVKFQTMITAKQTMTLELRYIKNKSSVQFRYFNDAMAFSSGKIQFS